MALNDPISNLLTCIRNASMVAKESVDVPASRMTEGILKIFKDDGYIEDFRLMKDSVQGTCKVYLKYDGRKPAITGLKRISKSGLRVYVKKDKVPRVLSGMGTAVISTSTGVIDDRRARTENVGGEILCHIW
jgi:small subunit ribosomal protein S8